MSGYDLEGRALIFAADIRKLIKRLPKTTANYEDGKQLIRASGSIGANYIEANEGLGTKDFILRLKIARKEAKESRFWLRLLDLDDDHQLLSEIDSLVKEATELMLILNAIIKKVE